jgi:cysteine-rich repeat protein
MESKMRFAALTIIILSACYDDQVLINPYERTTASGEVSRRQNAKPRPPGCGDGELDQGESCDDGNSIDNDGCNNACESASALPGLIARPVVDAVAGSRRFAHNEQGIALLAPFQPVRLSGRGSSAPNGEVTGFEWSLDSAQGASLPAGSQVFFDDDTKDRPRLMYTVRGDERPGVDLTGVYTVALRVQSQSERWSPWALVRFEAKPNRALWVELSWDVDAHDVDLHLIRGADSGRAFSDSVDCYFANCVPEEAGVSKLHWGASGGGDDPFLDVDDVDGLGPEVVSIPAPESGMTYIVALHMYRFDARDDAPTATLKIFVDGEVVHQIRKTMLGAEDWWEAVHLRWGDEVAFELVDVYADEPPNGGP